MRDTDTNPYIGEPVRCRLCGNRRPNARTTNINGICSRHPEGKRNLNLALLWEQEKFLWEQERKAQT